MRVYSKQVICLSCLDCQFLYSYCLPTIFLHSSSSYIFLLKSIYFRPSYQLLVTSLSANMVMCTNIVYFRFFPIFFPGIIHSMIIYILICFRSYSIYHCLLYIYLIQYFIIDYSIHLFDLLRTSITPHLNLYIIINISLQ